MFFKSFKLFRTAARNNKSEVSRNLSYAVLLEVLSVALLYILNKVYGDLYSGIQAYDTKAIWTNITYFTGIAMVLVAVNGYMGYFINRLAFAIREGLTNFYFNTVLIVPVNHSQRVQEDFKRFGESGCDFWFAVLKSALHIPVFIGVIISLTSLPIALSIITAVIVGTIFTRVIGKPLVAQQSIQESNEAEFRKELTKFNFNLIKTQFNIINKLFKRLAFAQSGLSQIFVLLPFMVLMPLYLAKTIPMGAFFQSVNALGKIIDSLSVLIDSRQTIVNIETCIVRLDFVVNPQPNSK